MLLVFYWTSLAPCHVMVASEKGGSSGVLTVSWLVTCRLARRPGTAIALRKMPIKLRSGQHLCVSPAGGSLELRTCGAGDPAHWWTYWSDGTLRPADDPSTCIDLAYFDRRDGAPLQLWGCNHAVAQSWLLTEGSGSISLAVDPSWCVDVPAGNLGPLTLYRCLYNHNQAFTFPSLLPATLPALAPVQLRWGATACLAGTQTIPTGAPVALRTCGTVPSTLDKWHLGGDGTLRLAASPTMCLDLHYNDPALGELLLIPCNGHMAQKWSLSAAGTVTLSRDPSHCVTAEGDSVALRPCANSPKQVSLYPHIKPVPDVYQCDK